MTKRPKASPMRADRFKAEALKACAGLKGADLEKAKAEIEKRYWEIATGREGPRSRS